MGIIMREHGTGVYCIDAYFVTKVVSEVSISGLGNLSDALFRMIAIFLKKKQSTMPSTNQLNILYTHGIIFVRYSIHAYSKVTEPSILQMKSKPLFKSILFFQGFILILCKKYPVNFIMIF